MLFTEIHWLLSTTSNVRNVYLKPAHFISPEVSHLYWKLLHNYFIQLLAFSYQKNEIIIDPWSQHPIHLHYKIYERSLVLVLLITNIWRCVDISETAFNIVSCVGGYICQSFFICRWSICFETPEANY